MRIHHLPFALVLALLASGCDTSGLHPLNSPISRTTNCGRSTWMRSTDTGTEVILLGELDPTTPVTATDVCFVRAFVEHDSSAVVEEGKYTLDETGAGVFNVEQLYFFTYDPVTPPLGRSGADIEEEPTPDTHEIGVALDGDQLILEMDGQARRLTNIYDVIAALDPTTLAGAEDVYRMFNLTLFTSQVRVLAFGGGGMTMYLNSKKTFPALVAGDFSVVVEYPLATTTISYNGYEDLHGIFIEGDQITEVNAAGNGDMRGALAFTMRGSDDLSDVILSGSVDYSNCIIGNGVGAGGFYGVAIDGYGTYEVSYELAADTDLRAVLPESTP